MQWNCDPPGLQALSFISYELNAFKEQLDLSEHCVCIFLQGMVVMLALLPHQVDELISLCDSSFCPRGIEWFMPHCRHFTNVSFCASSPLLEGGLWIRVRCCIG